MTPVDEALEEAAEALEDEFEGEIIMLGKRGADDLVRFVATHVLRKIASAPTPEMVEEAWLEIQAGHEASAAVSATLTALADQVEDKHGEN